jgi:L-galactose dehydrogenase
MNRKKLGSTDLEVSSLGFGASPLGDVFERTDPDEGCRAVQTAIDLGINFFDVSPYYGQTLAEERLGEGLRGRRDKIVLATKCGRYGENDFDFSRGRVKRSLEASLLRLGTDYVDLFQVHDVEFGSIDQIIEETIPAMRELQAEGKVRYIGITGYPLRMLRRIAEAVPVDTILSYCHYNLIATDMDELLTPFAQEHNIGLINASPLAMRLLTETGAPEWHPAPLEAVEAAKQIAHLCSEHGTNISALALQFCLAHSYVSCTLIGMATVQEVAENVRTSETSPDPRILQELRTLLEPLRRLGWASGRPENRD